jgi:hypothetical protein
MAHPKKVKDLKHRKSIIKAFELGLYSCTKDGFVYSHNHSRNDAMNKPVNRRLSQSKNSQGYVCHVFVIDDLKFTVLAHHAVILFFNREADFFGKCTNHIDANRANNSLENLEIVTQQQNILHAKKLGRLNTAKGEDQGFAKLISSEVIQIKFRINRGDRLVDIANDYKVHRQTIADIKHNKTWRHLFQEQLERNALCA